ncbi:MAG TPA: CRTAC1 family protein, partial [Planctomycetota bacterium]
MFQLPNASPAAVVLPTLFLLAAGAVAQQPSFSDQTTAANLDIVHTLDPVYGGGNPMIAGGAIGDFNRDGWPDLFVIGGGGIADALFLNNGDGTFTDHAAAWGVAAMHHGAAASVGDYDDDGFLDIFVTSYGPAGAARKPGKHRLYHNEGGAGFVDVAVAAGVNMTTPTLVSGSSSTFGDYDVDGDLDLYVASGMLGGIANRLFRNEGNGTFTDVTVAAGLTDTQLQGFVPTFADMDGDNYPELVNVADFHTSVYYVNNGDGTFTKLNPGPPKFDAINGMGSAFGDFDNDGMLDIYATGIYPTPGNILLLNQGSHAFLENAPTAGVADGGWGWGASAIDCDNDGWLDIVATNGWSNPHIGESTRLFRNNADGTFEEVSQSSGLVHTLQGRTVLRSDLDCDGAEDLVILSNQEPLKMFRNDSGAQSGHWLQVDLDTSMHPGLAPDGFGATVTVRWRDQERMRYLDGAPSYLGTSEHSLHFGLGTVTIVHEVLVRWADGSYTAMGNVGSDQRITIESGLPIEADELVRSQTASVSASGAVPGEWMLFLYSLRGVG